MEIILVGQDRSLLAEDEIMIMLFVLETIASGERSFRIASSIN